MPLILRFLITGVMAYIAGSIITPILWAPVLAQQAKQILSPFVMLSAAILIFAVVKAVREWRRI